MKKSLEIYCLLVCFFTVACFSITLGLFIYQSARVVLPQITIPSFAEDGYQSTFSELSEAQQKNLLSKAKLPNGYNYQQMQSIWNANYRISQAIERRSGIQGMLKYFIILFVDGLIFIPHWRIIRKNNIS